MICGFNLLFSFTSRFSIFLYILFSSVHLIEQMEMTVMVNRIFSLILLSADGDGCCVLLFLFLCPLPHNFLLLVAGCLLSCALWVTRRALLCGMFLIPLHQSVLSAFFCYMLPRNNQRWTPQLLGIRYSLIIHLLLIIGFLPLIFLVYSFNQMAERTNWCGLFFSFHLYIFLFSTLFFLSYIFYYLFIWFNNRIITQSCYG